MKKKLFLYILDKKRQAALKQLSTLFGVDCYLAGGTALALQLGHRESLDFDIFSNHSITFAIKNKLIHTFGKDHLQLLVDTADELTMSLDKTIKITLLHYYWPPLFPLVRYPALIPLLSIKDLAAAKAYAIGRRGNYRDYFDLYVIIKNGSTSLKNIIASCQKKYGALFSERMFLEQLIYLEDIEPEKKLRHLNEQYVSPLKLAAFFKSLI